MPNLFRIMGGGGHSQAASQPPPSSSAAAAAASSTASSSSSSTTARSRYTYPGQRAASLPTSTPRTGQMVGGYGTVSSQPIHNNNDNNNTASSSSSAASAPPMTAPSHMVLQGNPVGSAVNAASAPLPPAVSSAYASATGSNPPAPSSMTSDSNNNNNPSGGGSGGGAGSSSSGSSGPTRPGAYHVTRITTGPAQIYRVTVPPGVRPGHEFSVHAGPRRVRVRCPTSSKPGQSLQITLPPEPVVHHSSLKMASLTAAEGEGGGGAVAMSHEVQRVNEQAALTGGTAQTFLVTIPPNVHSGMQFTVNLNGQRFMVTCPPSAGPNQKVRIVPPAQPEEPEAAPQIQVFEVAVPPNVLPGNPFAIIANGQRVLVTCPPNVVPGQKIRFQLPVAQVVSNISLKYESESTGWRRTVRASDLKFQWVRIDETTDKKLDGTPLSSAANVVNVDGEFDFRKAAYVRKMTYLEGNDARMRTALVELIPAQEAVVDSKLVVHNVPLVSYSDIASVQGKTLDEKTEWFQRICSQLTAAWEDGHVKIIVRRKHLLLDSVDAVMSLGRDDLRKRWRIEFLGEPAIDAGGVAREWFTLVSEQLFDPDFGLWLSSANNQMCMVINPASGVSCPDDHLIYFRFLGRVLGRALFDRQLVKGHMVRYIYKHLLGWPITFEDIEAQDIEYYLSLKKLTKMDDVSMMCLDFTVTEESMGARQEIELVEGGSLKEVTNENLAQYLEANLKYRLLDRTKPQLTEILLGFFDVVPEAPLTVFDANELELILCGLPEIDMDDWQRNTNYSGLLEDRGKSSGVVQWFWDVVREDFDTEMKARLLQFVTGTSGVPSRGFSVLQGIDGNIKKFTVHGVDVHQYVYPRAHTCFNRIDLPLYDNKDELRERLKAAITLSGVGFDME